jgi:hypothetical protein
MIYTARRASVKVAHAVLAVALFGSIAEAGSSAPGTSGKIGGAAPTATGKITIQPATPDATDTLPVESAEGILVPPTSGDIAAEPAVPGEAQEYPSETIPTEPSGTLVGRVTRALFTSSIAGREPVDSVLSMSNDSRKIYYFTELEGMQGQEVMHRWEYNGQIMGDVRFQVGGPRWRVWSSKTLNPSWLGDWKVTVLNAAGEVIAENSFRYTASGVTRE